MNNAIKSCLTARVPVLVWGEPGAGKTSSIRAMAVEMNKPIWTVIARMLLVLPAPGSPHTRTGTRAVRQNE